jgi:hypothetical protein
VTEEYAGEARLANGMHFKIVWNPKKQVYFVIDMMTSVRQLASTYAKAWGAVNYLARIDQRTGNTTKWRGF